MSHVVSHPIMATEDAKHLSDQDLPSDVPAPYLATHPVVVSPIPAAHASDFWEISAERKTVLIRTIMEGVLSSENNLDAAYFLFRSDLTKPERAFIHEFADDQTPKMCSVSSYDADPASVDGGKRVALAHTWHGCAKAFHVNIPHFEKVCRELDRWDDKARERTGNVITKHEAPSFKSWAEAHIFWKMAAERGFEWDRSGGGSNPYYYKP